MGRDRSEEQPDEEPDEPRRAVAPTAEAARRDLVAELAGRGIRDRRVLDAMRTVERHRYVEHADIASAYQDRPLAIGLGQTISQPYMVAFMVEAAEIDPGDSVLEVGTGSGYGAAVLGCLAADVWTVERHAPLADAARKRLRRDGFDRVNVVIGDGAMGWEPGAPYDAIVVTACPPTVPRALLEQLADGGRLIIPVGRRRHRQRLLRIRREGEHVTEEDLGLVRFVPLISAD